MSYDDCVKRRLLLILLLLAGGAIINVAVALCPIEDWLSIRGEPNLASRGQWVWYEMRSVFGATLTLSPLPPSASRVQGSIEPLEQTLGEYGKLCMQDIERIHDPAAGTAVHFGLVSGRGFPMLALRGSVIEIVPPLSKWGQWGLTHDLRPNGMLLFKQNEPAFDFYPTIPIWPGFAINKVFYAAILWLLWAAPFALRTWLRIKRGQCLKRGYPIGTSEVCTECGATLPR